MQQWSWKDECIKKTYVAGQSQLYKLAIWMVELQLVIWMIALEGLSVMLSAILPIYFDWGH